ncbi:hypothetical protein M422DRAFT_23881 [Sphaerobolus stellatus SS14]|nr:hypothetical protein M422DRAFT_23881 [Sphaerobolus stellatus SS14]
MAAHNDRDENTPLLQCSNDVETTFVYPIIHAIRKDVIIYIDNPLSYEAMLNPDILYTLVIPLEDKYARLQRDGNLSIVFCFLINRVHFTRDQSFSTISLSQSRAALCEILATRLLRYHADDMLELTTVLTTSWRLFAGASPEVLKRADQEEDMDVEDSAGNAIEMAILGQAKRFIKSSPCQKIIDGIWSGKCVYQADSPYSFISDTYKRTPVHIYNPHTAPLLDHYRLKVPAVRSVLEYINFVILFVLFVVALEYSETDHINFAEILFMVYALGFSLEKLASIQEHGIRVYVTGTWNGFDVLFISVYGTYLGLRLYGITQDNPWALSAGMDCLALAACLIFPRLAFVTLSNNLMILSLRSMFTEFAILMVIATFCFAGFLYALWTLSRNGPGFTSSQIAWWMIDLFFGLDASGFDRSSMFHPVFGPVLMVSFACLSNTLLLTVLVSILSHTFSTISADAAAEAMYRRAVSTIEGVKADALFSYQPPLNLFALVVMLPASYIFTPRWFHKVNVFMIRLTSFPILLAISLYERHKAEAGAFTFYEHVSMGVERVFDMLPKPLKRISIFERFAGPGAEIDAVFDIEDELANENDDGFDMLMQTTSPRKARRVSNSFAGGGRPRRSSLVGGSAIGGSGRTTPTEAPYPPRRRAMSHRLSGVAESSPLAQIFTPLPAEEGHGILQGTALSLTPPHGTGTNILNIPENISYGPVSRRRLASIPHRAPSFPTNAMQPFPTGTEQHSSRTLRRAVSGPNTDTSGELTPPAEPRPKSVTQVVSESEMMGGSDQVQLERRLARIEQIQVRMENLLLQLNKAK